MKDSTKNAWKAAGSTAAGVLGALGRSIRVDQLQADYADTLDQAAEKMRTYGRVTPRELRAVEAMTRAVRMALEDPQNTHKVAYAEDAVRDLNWTL